MVAYADTFSYLRPVTCNSIPRSGLCLHGLIRCLVLETGLLEIFCHVSLGVFLLLQLSSGRYGATVNCLILLGGLASRVFAALLFLYLQAVDLFLSLADVLYMG